MDDLDKEITWLKNSKPGISTSTWKNKLVHSSVGTSARVVVEQELLPQRVVKVPILVITGFLGAGKVLHSNGQLFTGWILISLSPADDSFELHSVGESREADCNHRERVWRSWYRRGLDKKAHPQREHQADHFRTQ